MPSSLGLFFLVAVGVLLGGVDAFSGRVAVIDAGSSSSKLSLLVDGVVVDTLRVFVPGLSDFANDQRVACIKLKGASTCHVVNGSLLHYLYYMAEFLPGAYHPVLTTAYRTQLLLLGSAGMRTLDGGAAMQLYARASDEFYAMGFRRIIARTINGYEEAFFAWLTANADASRVTATSGVLDLGGSSAQVTFATADMGAPGVTQVNTTRFGTVPIFLQSYAGLGLDAALQTYLANVSASSGATLVSPCFPVGTMPLSNLSVGGLLKSSALAMLASYGVTAIQGTANLTACAADYASIVLGGNDPYGTLDELGDPVPGWTGVLPTRLNTTAPFFAIGAYVNVLGTETLLPMNTTLEFAADIVPALEAACDAAQLNWTYVASLGTLQARQGAVRRCADFAQIMALLTGVGVSTDDTIVLQATATWGPGAAEGLAVSEAFTPTPVPDPVVTETRNMSIAALVLLAALLVVGGASTVLLIRTYSSGGSFDYSKMEKLDKKATTPLQIVV